jgi:hypothetical protein
VLSGLLVKTYTRVLLNGIPGGLITHQKELRQGDPLLHMIFILAVDILGRLINKVEREGLLQALSTRLLQHRISIYANDVVLFLHPTPNEINFVMDISQLFDEASRIIKEQYLSTTVYSLFFFICLGFVNNKLVDDKYSTTDVVLFVYGNHPSPASRGRHMIPIHELSNTDTGGTGYMLNTNLEPIENRTNTYLVPSIQKKTI